MTEQSPVVPSVGAVPVEVPEDAVDAAAMAIGCYSPEQYERWRHTSKGQQAHDRALAGLQAAYPLIAAQVRAEGEQQFAEAERILAQAIRERDEAEEWADKLAAALAGDAAGEHSSANNPWQNALDIAADRDARVRAEERRRMLAAMEQPAFMQAAIDRAQLTTFTDDGGHDIGIMPGSHAAVAIIAARTELLAAGSAVPVATPPEHDAGCERAYGPEDCTCQRRADVDFSHTTTGPVATPADPVDEVKCPGCGATIRARMSDQPEVAPAEPTIAEQAGYYVVTFPGGDTSTWETNRSYLFNPTAVWQLRNNADALEAITRHRSRTAPAEQDGQR